MLDILKFLHEKYVPTVEKTVEYNIPSIQTTETIKTAYYHKIIVGGDQLTACRIRTCNCQEAMKNADDVHWKVDGIIPVIEDWHAMMCLLLVSHLMN